MCWHFCPVPETWRPATKLGIHKSACAGFAQEMWSGAGYTSSRHSTGGWLANPILKGQPYVSGCRDNLIWLKFKGFSFHQALNLITFYFAFCQWQPLIPLARSPLV